MVAVNDVLGCHSFLAGLDGDGYAVFVASSHHHHIFAAKAHVAGVDVGGNVDSRKVSYMYGTVGVG